MSTYDMGDRLAPRELIIPIVSGTITSQPDFSGAMFISGAYLYVRTSSRLMVLSGANVL